MIKCKRCKTQNFKPKEVECDGVNFLCWECLSCGWIIQSDISHHLYKYYIPLDNREYVEYEDALIKYNGEVKITPPVPMEYITINFDVTPR